MSFPPTGFVASLGDRYRIEREVGSGGMARVYLAEDLRHRRKVAIKVLHPELTAVLGSDRFLKEIEVTANLQHPHILPLFDSGTADAQLFYVMPYVEGESLRQRLDRERQLPIPDAVRITREVADALDYAHRHGIIHRDIKPENILLHEGRALVADFGIALAVRNAGGARVTETGLSLGTPRYMSPEQATAERELDARSDVYSLGCVLYEMLAGEPPHSGPTSQAIIAKIITDRPKAISELRETVSPGLADAVHTALAKLAADRFASAAEFGAALAHPEIPSGARRVATPRTSAFRRAGRLGLGVGGGLALLAAGWVVGRRGDRSALSSAVPSRLSILVPLATSGPGGLHRLVEVSPDGSTLVFHAGISGGRGALEIQRLDEDQSVPVSGSDLLFAPELSPDGDWIATRNLVGDLVLIPRQGTASPPAPLARGFAYYAWHPDGSLWVTRAPFRHLERLARPGDSLEVRLGPYPGMYIQQVLDDGRNALAIRANLGSQGGPGVVIDLVSGEVTSLVDLTLLRMQYTAGYLVYARADGALVAMPFDERQGRATGNAVTVATNVSATGVGDAQMSAAENGTVAFITEDPRMLVFVDRSGAERPATGIGNNYHMPRFSPDGRRVSVDFTSSEGREVWILDREQATLSRVTFTGDGHDASWAPDGKYLAFTTFKSGVFGLYRVSASGDAPAESLLVSNSLAFTGVWLPDGSGLATIASDLEPGSVQDLALVRNGGRGPLEPLVVSPFTTNYPALSPDGRYLAYVSNQSGRPEVYVRSLATGDDQIQVSQTGGDEPVWARSGAELFYRGYVAGSDAQLVGASVATRPALRVTARTPLFSLADYIPMTPHAGYDVAPDGRTFVFVRRNPTSRITLIQNLPALVARLKP